MTRAVASLLAAAMLAGCDPAYVGVARVDDRLAQPPGAPAVPDDGASVGPRVLAIHEILVEQEDAWRQIGFDLDGYVTTATEQRQGCVAAQGDPPLDGEGGIDNAFGSQVAPVLRFILPNDFEAVLRAEHAAGRGALVVRVDGWNGTADDPVVEATITQAVDGTSAPAEDVAFEGGALVLASGGGDAPPPAWDGGDTFVVREEAFAAVDASAYVSGGTLVARVASLELLLAVPGYVGSMRLDDVVLTASMATGSAGCGGGMLAGRFGIDALLVTAEAFGICEESEEWAYIVDDALENADVPLDPAGAESEVCDAISSAFRFDACASAAIAGSVASPAADGPCD